MTTVNPYLTFNGNCEEAFNFYKSVFGGDFQFIGRYKDVPATDRKNFPKETDNMIMHVSLPISKETILMGCDSVDALGQSTAFGSKITLSITTDSRTNADRIFVGLSTNGQVRMAMNETFWGSYFGVVADKFGIHWTISCDVNE
jgi:PhnB protein